MTIWEDRQWGDASYLLRDPCGEMKMRGQKEVTKLKEMEKQDGLFLLLDEAPIK